MNKSIKKKIETYIDETNAIKEKYNINQNDIDKIKELCQMNIPEIRIKNSERINFCIQQKELAELLLRKTISQLENYNLKIEAIEGRWILDADEEEYGRLRRKNSIDESIYQSYDNRSKESKQMILNLIYKLYEIRNYFYGEAGKQIKGTNGENLVQKYFSMFSEKYPSRTNVLLPIEDEFAKSSELDSIIITPKGIFVCEIKNWGNEKESLYIAPDDSWYIVKNKKRERIKNPFEQNIRHVLALEKYLRQNGISCKLIPLVVIADNKTSVVNENRKPVIKSAAVYEYIENQPIAKTVDAEKQKQILALIDSLDVEENTFPCMDFSSVFEEFDEAINKAFTIREKEVKLEKELLEKCKEMVSRYEKRNYPIIIILSIIAIILASIFVIRHFKGIMILIGIGIIGSIYGWINQ